MNCETGLEGNYAPLKENPESSLKIIFPYEMDKSIPLRLTT